ncbi:protein translocase subunit yidC [Litorimonas taeanensis]|uniref:Membrane protein insertase YidC n=1 Tax=Litorimonas taeanensis TaxID=568099 RepID=A0A420WDZ2_9PROT|nr:membrane protein insertase YidC [Litorimonas taeanensis]RKQ69239.1 protein translocase subunit yidC [Litorimonas taeanensis]
MNEQRNFILAMVLSALVLIGYWVFYQGPAVEKAKANAEQEMARAKAEQSLNGTVSNEVSSPIKLLPRENLVGQGTRIKIDSPSIRGSFLTTGAHLDDVTLKNYDETLDAADGQVSLLSPEGSEKAAYITDNWVKAGLGTQGFDTPWAVISGTTLTPETPVTLGYTGDGYEVRRTMSIDDRYLITLEDVVTNTSGSEIALQRKGVTRQHSLPDDLTNFFIIQEGPISIVDNGYSDMKYKSLRKKGDWTETGTSGWVGLTDKYWLLAAIAPQEKTITAERRFRTINDQDVYETSYTLAATTLTAGASITSKGYMFSGAKDRDVLKTYEKDLGIAQMERAIDWGFVGILVKPIYWALSRLGELFGNFGIGILALTLIIKLFMFPLFNKQYESQAKMKKVQPKLKKLQERYKEDRVKLQQEMMALYKREGANPVAGCLPIIPTIFVFFALYKSVFINIDMRHAPFFGWIQDLSAKDPLSILNLFGALPWSGDPFGIAFLAIGPLAILYGISMSLMYTLTPPAGGGEQAEMMQKMMKWMPWIFMFVLAPFPAGLLLYWVWNNVLSFGQQYYITRKFKVDTPIDAFFRKLTGKAEPEAPK